MKKFDKKKIIFRVIILIFITNFTALFLLIQIENDSFETNIKEQSLPKLSNNGISIITPENKTYTGAMSGYYPSTCGFENDSNGKCPTGWEERSTSGHSVNVISEKFGHKKVLEGYDAGSGACHIRKNFCNTEGTIEFWMAHTSTDYLKQISTHVYDSSGSSALFGVVLHEGNIYIAGSSVESTIMGTYSVNRWYHFKFVFRSLSGNPYEDLGQNKFKFYINEIYKGTYGFYENGDPGFIQVRSLYNTPSYYGYWDAFGFSWHPNYNTGDNFHEGLLLNFENSTNLDWIGYSLDGQTNITICGDKTIKIPDNGTHSIQVFGTDSTGKTHQSDIRYFSTYISVTADGDNGGNGGSTPDPYSVIVIITIVIIVGAVIGVAILLTMIASAKKPKTASIQPGATQGPPEVQTADVASKNCPYCNTPLSAGDEFCRFCGHKL